MEYMAPSMVVKSELPATKDTIAITAAYLSYETDKAQSKSLLAELIADNP